MTDGSDPIQSGSDDPNKVPDQDNFWLLRGDEHNVKESFLVGRVESKPLELIEKEQDEIWKGNFFGDGCNGDQEKRYREYYPDMSTSCRVHVYRTPKVKGYYRLGDIATEIEVAEGRGPVGYLIKAREEKETDDHIRLPLYFSLVWREPYNGTCLKLKILT